MWILKFGGSSLADAKRFTAVAQIIAERGVERPLGVVLSAMAGVTNALVRVADESVRGEMSIEIDPLRLKHLTLIEDLPLPLPALAELRGTVALEFQALERWSRGIALLGECPPRVRAKILCRGEFLSVAVMRALLEAMGLQVQALNAVEVIVSGDCYLNAQVDIPHTRRRLAPLRGLARGVLLLQGFVAGNAAGELTTLGRNGSDYSAAVLAAGLDAERCEIWTDVDGIYNCDPNLVPDARLIRRLSYREAMEMSYFGAKVLHPKTIAPIAQFHIPCYIKNSADPAAPGSRVDGSSPGGGRIVKGISNLNALTMINVSGPGMKGMVGMAARVFAAMWRAGISVVLITQSSSEYSISFCVPGQQADRARTRLESEFELELKNRLLDPIELEKELAIVSLVGDRMRSYKGIAARMFTALARSGVNVAAIAQGSSERSISAVIPESSWKPAVRACHHMFFHTRQPLRVFLLGCGAVGGELLQQIRRLPTPADGPQLRVCGLADSKGLLLREQGIDPDGWSTDLSDHRKPFSIERLRTFLERTPPGEAVLVDCTSDAAVAALYPALMEVGFHVVAANKKANTAGMDPYRALRRTARARGRRFYYETNVGAGLPVIAGLQQLLRGGDRLTRFQGILSGSLSFLFGKLQEGMPFSSAVARAHERRFTEPDPRDDLSGMDVGRKLLILARECGLTAELDGIAVDPVLPAQFAPTGSVAEFMAGLPAADAYFRDLCQKARDEHKVLRYVGEIENGRCRASIQAVDAAHPLHAVLGGENAFAFWSDYYDPIPLVIRGYGAGTSVTAAGVLADILRIADDFEQGSPSC